jgi:hypothetical protein
MGNERNFSGLIAVVAATVTLTGAVLTTVGISAGVITGLLRNDGWRTAIFLCVALFGVLLGVASAFVTSLDPSLSAESKRHWSGMTGGILAILGVLVLFVGVGLVVWRASSALKTTSRPSIAVTVIPLDKPAGDATLEATLTASGVTTQERYRISAELLTKGQQEADRPVFTTFVGPGADGNVDYSFKVQFPINLQYPWIAVTAQLSEEGTIPHPTQACGLPEQPHTPSNAPNHSGNSNSHPSISESPSPSPSPVPSGTTCVIAIAPAPSANPWPTPTAGAR